MQVSVKSQCQQCDIGLKPAYSPHDRLMMHGLHFFDRCPYGLPAPGCAPCRNYDDECRHLAEPLGYYTFAFLPQKCRNGKWRWLRPIERHDDGTYTLGNRAS